MGPFFKQALCGVSLNCSCQLSWCKARFSADFIERLFGGAHMSRNVVEGIDRLPWEALGQFSLRTAQQELGFSHLHFDISPFRLHWANHSLSLLGIPQVVKSNCCKRVVNILLKHPGMSRARFMFVTD